jgi:thiamine biosynthesis lipoprotein
MTLYRDESPLVAFNRGPGAIWFEAPPELIGGARAALDGAARSGGVFDPTVAGILRDWGLHELRGRDPDPSARRSWSARPDWRAVELDAANRRMRRLDPRAELDLGGVGKGIAVDAALEELASAGSRSALVNLGGSIGVLGPPPGSPEGWPVALVHPRRPGEFWSRFRLAGGHLATSGDYERWVVTPRGHRKHHLLDPATGEPTEGVAAVTAWAGSGTEADLASTALMVRLGREDARRAPGTERLSGHAASREGNSGFPNRESTGGWLAILDRDGSLIERTGSLAPQRNTAPARGVVAGAAERAERRLGRVK